MILYPRSSLLILLGGLREDLPNDQLRLPLDVLLRHSYSQLLKSASFQLQTCTDAFTNTIEYPRRYRSDEGF